MKRKIMKIADTTFVVSLPLKWAREHGVKKGDEVEMEENGPSILLSLKEKKEQIPRVTEINLRSLSKDVIKKSVSGLYKRGFDEIKIKLADKMQIKIIQDIVKDIFIGFIMSDQSKESCIIKSISEDNASDFDRILKRLFLVNTSFFDQCLECLRSDDFETLASLIPMEDTNNQLTNYCQRLINKGLVSDNPYFLYIIAWNLEKVADEMEYICKYVSANKMKLSTDTLSYFEKTGNFYRAFFDFFYKYDPSKVDILNTINEELTSLGKELFQKTSKKELFVVVCIYKMVDIINNFLTTTVGLYHTNGLEN
ncbi:MAG: AbrB/MazE/SpoVT family DNA-binding domain-containing protein [archaeon]